MEYSQNRFDKAQADLAYASALVSGEVGVLRHLHCNERIHRAQHKLSTNAAEIPPPRNILYVIADYYAVQIVVFQHLGKDADPPGFIDPDKPHGKPIYTASLFGFMEDSTPREQIFLVTTDWRRFSPVEWVGKDDRPTNAVGVPWFQPHASVIPPMDIEAKRRGVPNALVGRR